jgi:hypothetical protein
MTEPEQHADLKVPAVGKTYLPLAQRIVSGDLKIGDEATNAATSSRTSLDTERA